jgi:transposase
MSCENSLPLWCVITAGSMSDKVVAGYVLKSLEKLGVANFTCVGDRGFYSNENLLNLVKREHKFTLTVPSHIIWQKQMIGEHKDSLRKAENALEDDQTIIYGKTVHNESEYVEPTTTSILILRRKRILPPLC